MIYAILIFNNFGKPRLTRFYSPLLEDEQQKVLNNIYQIVSTREENVCCFLEIDSSWFGPGVKIVYRQYATLFFVFCIDDAENELGTLDLMQVFVETLDKKFQNVCELDLVFHFDQVNHILDEIVMGGIVLETDISSIIDRLDAQDKIVRQESGIKAAPSLALTAVKKIHLPQQIKDIGLSSMSQFRSNKFQTIK